MAQVDMNDEYFKNNFNTPIPEDKAVDYAKFLAQYAKSGRDISDATRDYDLQGYFMGGGKIPEDGQAHFVDTYKKPNHMTFSDQSMYHNTTKDGVTFLGGSWGGNDEAGYTYTPSAHQISTPDRQQRLIQYFKKVEPNSSLIFPMTDSTSVISN
jgi:hypothetical protein